MTRRRITLLLGLAALMLPLQVAAKDGAPARPDRFSLQALAPPAPPAAALGVREDTLFLFAASGPGAFGAPGTDARGYTFDNASGGPVTAGWTPVDLTVQAGAWWNLADADRVDGHPTDMTAAGQPWTAGDANNDYALWCGRENVCGWINPTGYGNSWEQYVNLAQPGFTNTLQVNFAYNSDFEGDTYDFFTVEIEVNGVAEEVFRHNTAADRTFHNFSVTIDKADYPTGASFGDVLFHFSADGGWSDEDGSFISDIGAVWLDNLELRADGSMVFRSDFETGVLPAQIDFTIPVGAGNYGALYQGLFAEDICVVNASHAWAFFDLNTTNPAYPIPVTVYGPPYMDSAVRSPLLERAHSAGVAGGQPLAITASTQINLEYMVYLDMPLNSLIFEKWRVAAVTVEQPCLSTFKDDQTSYYGDQKIWFGAERNITLQVAEAAAGGTITGLVVQMEAIDRCPVWCNQYGDGTGHTPAPYYDNVRIKLIDASAVAWNVDQYRRFQDNFPELSGKVRIDSSDDVAPLQSSLLVIGDSTIVELNMDLVGGIKANTSNPTGQARPEFKLWFRVVAGPHAGSTSATMGDPDASDGIWTPHVGTADFNGITFNAMLADTARYQGLPVAGSYAFDFNDAFFEPGDVIEFFYRAESTTGVIETRPRFATSSDPDLRTYYRVRCLPTAGVTMLYCEDNLGDLPWWDEAFRYNGYADYDVYSTQAPSSGLNNGLSGRAELGDIDQYELIVWDSGNLPSYTLSNALPEDKTFDTVLLDDWLTNSSHDTHLWVLGCEVANDLGGSDPFLGTDLGAQLLFATQYLDDVTGVLVPKVFATHPALEWLGGDPSFWVDGGCPSVENFAMVAPAGQLTQESHAWQNDGGTAAVAGIYNRDPDGNGQPTSPSGRVNRTLFNPFAYFQTRDAGYGVDQNVDYARRMVGDILTNLLSRDPDTAPDGVDEVPAVTALRGSFPNPFNPKTTLRFALAADSPVHLSVYDLTGRRVRQLLAGERRLAAGEHEVVWDGRNDAGDRVASGVYFVRMDADAVSQALKLVMLK